MARQDRRTTNRGPLARPEKENKVQRSWAEEHGGLIFLIIAVSVICLAVLYDSCMY